MIISEEIRRLEQAVTACIPAIAQKVMLAAENLGISEEMSADYPYMKYECSSCFGQNEDILTLKKECHDQDDTSGQEGRHLLLES